MTPPSLRQPQNARQKLFGEKSICIVFSLAYYPLSVAADATSNTKINPHIMNTDYLNRPILTPANVSLDEARKVEKTGAIIVIPHHNGGFEIKPVRPELIELRRILVNAPTHMISADRVTPYVFEGDKLVRLTPESVEATLAEYSASVGRALRYEVDSSALVDVIDVETGLSQRVGAGGLNSQVYRWT